MQLGDFELLYFEYILLLFLFILIVFSFCDIVFFFRFFDLDLYKFDLFISKISQMFLILVVFVSLFIFLYSIIYMYGEFSFGYYISVMIVFIISIICLLVSSNWVSLILRWEGLGIRRFFLINYNQAWESINNSMVTILTIRFGDFFIFLLLRYYIYMSYFNLMFLVRVDSWIFLIFCFTKSANIPFTGWLPKAISAPTPTSALVHSSTLVTAGLVLIINYSDLLKSGVILLIIVVFGCFTIIIGSVSALFEFSIKKIVAYRTLSQMGLSIISYGLGGFYLGFMNLVAHGFAKSLLFMQVGYIIHLNYSQQNFRKWRFGRNIDGLLRLQVQCTLFSICALVFISGILSKEIILDSLMRLSWRVLILSIIIFFIFITIFYSFLIYKSLFNSSMCRWYINLKSVLIIFFFIFELLFVFFYFYWLYINMIVFNFGFIYLEIWLSFLIIFFFLSISIFVFRLESFYLFIIKLIIIFSGYRIFNFLKFLLLNLKFDYFLFFLNRYYMSRVVFYIIKGKLRLGGYYIYFVMFFIFFLFLFI